MADGFLAAVEVFARGGADAAAGWASGAAPGPEAFRAAAAIGLFGIEVPETFGGLGLGFGAKARAAAALAAADFGFAMSIVNTQNVAARLATTGPRAPCDRWLGPILSGGASACTALTEPGAGSDFAAIRTQARRDGAGWVLTGEKAWIINARHARLAIVYAQCGAAGERDGIGAFLLPLDAPGVRRRALGSDFSQHSMGTGAFTMEGCAVGEDHLLLAPGEAFGAIMAEINGARVYVGAMCCGMLSAALEAAAAWGARRRSFGRPLIAHQGWRFGLAEAATDLAAARALVAEAMARVEAGEDAQLPAAQAKLVAVAAARRHIPELMHLMGAEGLSPAWPFARHIGGVQSAGLTDGSTEMLLERVARLVFGGGAGAKGGGLS